MLYSATVCLHPLATVTTAQTIGSPASTTLNDSKVREDFTKTKTEPLLADKIRSLNRDHTYPKLSSFVPSSKTSGPVPTVILFDSLKCGQNFTRKGDLSVSGRYDELEVGEEEEVDVVSLKGTPKLPYDDTKVRTAMLECENHVNLVKLISAKMEKRDLNKATPQQKSLLLRVCEVLQADRLARLAYTEIEDEPVYRRIHTDRAARKVRQAFADVHWETKVIHWVNEVLLQSLDPILLPVYLDVLQVLKSKCPVLLERTIKAIVPKDSMDAFDFLLKRPWNPVVGLAGMDKQVKLQPSPNFVIVPHSPYPVSGRRMKSWQHQLGNIGKVYQVVLPSHVTEAGHTTSAEACARYIIIGTCSKVQELTTQYPDKPVVLITWLSGVRMAVKVAETMSVSCIIALGPTTRGAEKVWDLPNDPIATCQVPIMFVAGGNSPVCKVDYVETLRQSMQALNKLVVVNCGDEMLRLQPPQLMELRMTQPMVDRCIQHEIFAFLVQALPVKLMSDELKVVKKRKSSMSQGTHELSSSHLTPIPLCVSPIPIPLEPEAKKPAVSRINSAGSSGTGSKGSAGSHSHFKSSQSGKASVSRTHKSTPGVGRPSGKSTKKTVSYPAQKNKPPGQQTPPPSTAGSFAQVSGLLTPPAASKVPSPSMSMSPSISPSQLLQVAPTGMLQPMPATPPRNPFATITESHQSQPQLAPATLKQLNQPAVPTTGQPTQPTQPSSHS